MKEPKIRFKGFTGEWEKKHVQDVCNIISPTYKLQSCDYLKSGKYPIVDQSQSLVCGWSNSDRGLISDVPVIIFGDHTCILKYIDFPCIQGADGVKILLPKKDYIPTFVYQSFLSNPVIQDSYKRHFSDLKEKTFSFPPTLAGQVQNLAEQQKVASYFQNLNSLIQSTTKKIESLKQVKVASLQSMFPQEGETTPRVRFKGFEGGWEKVQMGQLGTTYSGLTGKTKEDFGNGDARFVTFLNVLTNAKIDTSILESVNVIQGENQNEVKKGDLLFNTSSETPEEVGMCAVMDEDLENVYLNSFCFGFRVTDSNIESAFIAYLMRSHIGRQIMSILAQGATRYNLSKTSFCSAELLVPKTKEEQIAIANYFSNLDSQISLLSQRLEKLQQIKSACLDKMFV